MSRPTTESPGTRWPGLQPALLRGQPSGVACPQALTPMGEHFSTNFSSWDLAVPGSPSISRLMSPRRVSPSGSLGEDRQVGQAGTQAGHGEGWQWAPQPASQASVPQAGGGSGLRPSFTAVSPAAPTVTMEERTCLQARDSQKHGTHGRGTHAKGLIR